MSLFAICYVLYAICYLLFIIKQAPAFSSGKFNLCAITSKNRITNIFAPQRYKTNPVPSKQFPNFFPKKIYLSNNVMKIKLNTRHFDAQAFIFPLSLIFLFPP